MNTKIEIETLATYLDQIETPPDKTKLHYIYRGQKNGKWTVQSSALRRLPKPSWFTGYLLQTIDETNLLYARTYSGMAKLECMAHLQHNRVATGLIDFTYSPLVALWFACEVDEPKEKNKDGKVFMLNTGSAEVEEIKNRQTVDKDLETFFDDDEKWYLWQPSIGSTKIDTDRITIQQSVFMFGMPEMPNKMFDKIIVVPKGCKEKLREELAKTGITEKTLFSDLAGYFERNTHKSSYDSNLIEDYHTEQIQASRKENGNQSG